MLLHGLIAFDHFEQTKMQKAAFCNILPPTPWRRIKTFVFKHTPGPLLCCIKLCKSAVRSERYKHLGSTPAAEGWEETEGSPPPHTDFVCRATATFPPIAKNCTPRPLRPLQENWSSTFYGQGSKKVAIPSLTRLTYLRVSKASSPIRS